MRQLSGRLVLPVVLFAVVTLLAACGGSGGSGGPGGGGPGGTPTPTLLVTLSSDAMAVEPGGDVVITASVTGSAADSAVVQWGAAQGELSATQGESTTWTAPLVPGTYEVTATVSAPGASAVTDSIEVVVTDGLFVMITDYSREVWGLDLNSPPSTFLTAVLVGPGADEADVEWEWEAAHGIITEDYESRTSWLAIDYDFGTDHAELLEPGDYVVSVTAEVGDETLEASVTITVLDTAPAWTGEPIDLAVAQGFVGDEGRRTAIYDVDSVLGTHTYKARTLGETTEFGDGGPTIKRMHRYEDHVVLGTPMPEQASTEYTYHTMDHDFIYEHGGTSRSDDGSSETDVIVSGTKRIERLLAEIGQSWENDYTETTTFRTYASGALVFTGWEIIELRETWTVTDIRPAPVTVPAGSFPDAFLVTLSVHGTGTSTDSEGGTHQIDTVLVYSWWINADGLIVKQAIDTGMGVGVNELVGFED